ncbi:TIGR01621 family pseudouridine synthase [Paraglaciecola aquimarina]|uniref:TIGR01621 family pseudouridine synthase n=1 Tax=Paraglaciecola algarum TaxID=3050085 RepID=A0ABS9DBU3_9ALTE|nr:TIGR01621 family pseudouridine synthase [Paraglaciecola sp. G1-23]MCF2950435.1 TIGR01621 family pseudouridine synthase [Paraglaciecola sp. G1-23]
MYIDVLLDHPDFVIINKPANIAVQNENDRLGILPSICQQLQVSKLWLVHRLDKVTSGILILAKHAQAAAIFGQLFENKQVEKYYLAIASKKPKKKQGSIKGGMHKVRDGKWILNSNNQNLAITQFFSYGVLANIRLFLVKPLTGKTHQIRVALKSLASPILGDELYKGETSDRTYLHAYAVKFCYQQQEILVTCKPNFGEHFISIEMSDFLNKLASPTALPWPKVK